MSFDNERDDFWDLDKLVPKKKKIIAPFAAFKRAVDYIADGEPESDKARNKLSFDSMKGVGDAEETVYKTEGAGLVRSVRIKRFIDKYDFYGNFRKAALLYYDYRTEKCDFVSYYSYMPQYSQLNTEQKNYYFYWRSALREKRYLKSDYSYLYLYVYEILNLPDKIPPQEGLELLVDLWRAYRKELPRIDSYFSLWMQDYCLVYQLSCPTEKIRDFIFEAVSISEFKEFYLSDIEKSGLDGVNAMLAYLSDYDWRKGKYAGGENRELYSKHMLSAMRRLLLRMDLSSDIVDRETALLRRDAFTHSLCTHAVKCKLEVEYIPLSKNEKTRAAVTGGVRYTENKLRALLGVKSRLAVKDLSEEYKLIVDGYFDSLFAIEAKKRAKENEPEYERLYDAPKESLSFVGADEIEKASWNTTLRLVDTEDSEFFGAPLAESGEETSFVTRTAQDGDTVGNTVATEECAVSDYGLSASDIKALLALSLGEGKIDDSVAERINEAFSDGFGDVILETDGNNYKIIEDYEQEIAEWLRGLTK
jgi:hypothetical protein